MGCGKFHVGGQEFSTGVPHAWDTGGRDQLDRWGFCDRLFSADKNQTVVLADDEGEPQDSYTEFLHQHGLLNDHIEGDKTRSCTDPDGTFTYPETPFWTETASTSLPQEYYFDDWITRNGLSLLDRAPADSPWFLQVNLQNPHHPWDVTGEMQSWYREPAVEFPAPTDYDLDVSAGAHADIRRNDSAMVERIDPCVG